MPTWLSILIGFTTLISTGVAIFVAYMAQKSRADQAEFQIKLLAVVDLKLSGYLTKEVFEGYSELHGKEHVTMNYEIGKLRDIRNGVTNLLLKRLHPEVKEEGD